MKKLKKTYAIFQNKQIDVYNCFIEFNETQCIKLHTVVKKIIKIKDEIKVCLLSFIFPHFNIFARNHMIAWRKSSWYWRCLCQCIRLFCWSAAILNMAQIVMAKRLFLIVRYLKIHHAKFHACIIKWTISPNIWC